MNLSVFAGQFFLMCIVREFGDEIVVIYHVDLPRMSPSVHLDVTDIRVYADRVVVTTSVDDSAVLVTILPEADSVWSRRGLACSSEVTFFTYSSISDTWRLTLSLEFR